MRARHHRQREIAEVLVRHGWGYLLTAMTGGRPVEPAAAGEQHSPAEHLRLALEELGPTFIKLGQLVSLRADLLAPEYRRELAKLQDNVAPIPGSTVWEVVGAELGDRTDTAFASFDLDPLAAGSIGQAHGATLPDGTEVVVKVRRPGVVEQVDQDLEILRDLASRATRHSTQAALLNVVGLVDEFAHTLRAELDYLAEGRNAERFAASFADDPNLQIPRVFWDTTTSRMITLERITGMNVSDGGALDAAGIDRHELAERASHVVLKMVLEDGFFHADPHPGNFFIQPDGRVGLIDFGMVGTLDERLRMQLARLTVAVMREDADGLARCVVELTTTTAPVDRVRLREDLSGIMQRYSGLAIGDIAVSAVIVEMLEIVRRHKLRTRRETALLLRTFAMNEVLATQLDPEFRLLDAIAPHARRMIAAQFSPASIARRLERGGLNLAELLFTVPEQARRIAESLDDGGLALHLRADELEPLVARVERTGNRIAVSVVVAAAITGLSRGWPWASARSRRRRPRLRR